MTDKIEKKGHNITLKGLVIHQVNKLPTKKRSHLKLREKELPKTKKEIAFISDLNNAYFKRSSPTYGIFGDDDTTFKEILKKYLNEEISFFDFTKGAAKHYNKIIGRVTQASGGLVIFTHFINTKNNNEYVFILMINNKNGFGINEDNLTIDNVKDLDFSKLDVACSINITKWEKIESDEEYNESKTYLSFIKGKKDVSNYFMNFIDCKDKTNSIDSTKLLVKAINKFCKEKEDIKEEGYSKEESIKKKNAIFSYCIDCLNSKKEISLKAISALFNNEKPEEFAQFASSEENGVSEI
ncbi:MAG: nucleoid-associated protein, partial [Bacteroidales bacterium]|nr:nucleoid-associated protein [Bacteroidales bacterium]